jgi:hypothetical protein
MLGTNSRLSRMYGTDPRKMPEYLLGIEKVPHASGAIGVFGNMVAIGRAQSHAWVPLAATAEAGNTSILLEGIVHWQRGSEIIISPTDFDPHESETRIIQSITFLNRRTLVNLNDPLAFSHYSEERVVYGTKTMQMQAKVGLLSRNIVIRGNGEGEKTPYTKWNLPKPTSKGGSSVCNNRLCEDGENSFTCPQDCLGPSYEYGVSLLVSSYSEDFVSCTKERVCSGGFRRSFTGSLNLSNVEFKYYGQNNLRFGLTFSNLGEHGKNTAVQNISMNRGYFGSVLIDLSSSILFCNSVFFRAFLPSIEVKSGSNNTISNVLGVIGIFWNTHRRATQATYPSSSADSIRFLAYADLDPLSVLI